MTDVSSPPVVAAPTAKPSPRRPTPGLMYGALRVFELSLGEMLWSKRTIFMGLVVGLPVLMSIVVRLLSALSGGGAHVNNVVIEGPAIFGLMMWLFYLRFSVPVLGVFYGTALIADEIEDKTITFLFTRPIPRGSVLLGKYLAYLVCTIFIVLPSIVLVWLAVIPIGGSLGRNFIDLVKDLAIVATGLAVYGALFALVGAQFKRPLLIGLLFVFAWEQFATLFPGLKELTVAFYLQGLVPQAMPSADLMSLVQGFFRETPSLTTSLACLGAMEVVLLWLASRVVATREYVLEQ